MPTINAPKRLQTLLNLLRSNGVTSYSDGQITLTISPAAAIQRMEFVEGSPKSRPQPLFRQPKDPVDIAIQGIDYDPDSDVSDLAEEDFS